MGLETKCSTAETLLSNKTMEIKMNNESTTGWKSLLEFVYTLRKRKQKQVQRCDLKLFLQENTAAAENKTIKKLFLLCTH